MKRPTTIVELPRLLYLGDVPVEASYHGSALLYRLLQTYPTEMLNVVEGGISSSEPKRRLSKVAYHALPLLFARLLSTRFAPFYEAVLLRWARWRALVLLHDVRGMRPEAILTVTHGISWITAAELGRHLQLPVHLICHDDWIGSAVAPTWKKAIFGEYYRRAASRLCVSPYMAQKYEQIYGAPGRVLYPSRSVGSLGQVEPPERLTSNPEVFTCAFAGTINSRRAASLLAKLGRCLEEIGGRLLIFGPLTEDKQKVIGLSASNIELGGLLGSDQLIEQLRILADALFVPMSFDDSDRSNMEVGFPSKLADYTAVGLPLIICGPDYCSAVKWARTNMDSAEIVVEESHEALVAAVMLLASSAERRIALARGAILAGEKYFSHTAADSVLRQALCGGGGSEEPGRDAELGQ